jgi:2-keto-4-pentenoate hydratase/2-oxohepta-3-ene-1,7-dioic acid hydratase in catechol pathway
VDHPGIAARHDNLHLITRGNGVVTQDASTKQMYFKIPRVVSELSQGLTLEPGDIIVTGTPPGVGHAPLSLPLCPALQQLGHR